MQYKSYQHLEKLGSLEVEDILQGDIYVFYKIDGTNSCVWLKDDKTLGFGSRKRELSLVQDNQGFVQSVLSNKELEKELTQYLTKHPNHIIYGEFLVPHALKTYSSDAWKKFYVFDILDVETGKYINYDSYSKSFDKNYKHISYIPLLEKLHNPKQEEIQKLLSKTGQWLIADKSLGEGICIKNYDYINKYGRTTWAKMLTEDYIEIKHNNHRMKQLDKKKMPTEEHIALLLTEKHIIKEFLKIKEKNPKIKTEELIGRTFKQVYEEFIHDNIELIVLGGFKDSKIDFKKLRYLCNQKTKEYLRQQGLFDSKVEKKNKQETNQKIKDILIR